MGFVCGGVMGIDGGWGAGTGGAGVEVPEDAVDKRAVVLPGVAALTVVVAVGAEALDTLPWGVGEVKAVVPGWPPWGNLPAREMGSSRGSRATPMPDFSETTWRGMSEKLLAFRINDCLMVDICCPRSRRSDLP